MKCLFSCIAWDATESSTIAPLLRCRGISGIEVAPGFFSTPLDELTTHEIKTIRNLWSQESLPAKAMQALLYGKPDLLLFGDKSARDGLFTYLISVFRIAGQLGCGPLVFGSPKNRLRVTLPYDAAFAMAVDFFSRLAPLAAAEGCTLCIEANAADYGCDFITTHSEAIALVQAVDAPGFGLQIDTGVMQMNGETPTLLAEQLHKASIIPTHVHISEPMLVPVRADTDFHRQLSHMLWEMHYPGFVSVEMKKTDSLDYLRVAAETVFQTYGGYNV